MSDGTILTKIGSSWRKHGRLKKEATPDQWLRNKLDNGWKLE